MVRRGMNPRDGHRMMLVWLGFLLSSPVMTICGFKYVANSGVTDVSRAGVLMLPVAMVLPFCAASAACIVWAVKRKVTIHLAYFLRLLPSAGMACFLVPASYAFAMPLPLATFLLLSKTEGIWVLAVGLLQKDQPRHRRELGLVAIFAYVGCCGLLVYESAGSGNILPALMALLCAALRPLHARLVRKAVRSLLHRTIRLCVLELRGVISNPQTSRLAAIDRCYSHWLYQSVVCGFDGRSSLELGLLSEHLFALLGAVGTAVGIGAAGIGSNNNLYGQRVAMSGAASTFQIFNPIIGLADFFAAGTIGILLSVHPFAHGEVALRTPETCYGVAQTLLTAAGLGFSFTVLGETISPIGLLAICGWATGQALYIAVANDQYADQLATWLSADLEKLRAPSPGDIDRLCGEETGVVAGRPVGRYLHQRLTASIAASERAGEGGGGLDGKVSDVSQEQLLPAAAGMAASDHPEPAPELQPANESAPTAVPNGPDIRPRAGSFEMRQHLLDSFDESLKMATDTASVSASNISSRSTIEEVNALFPRRKEDSL